MRILLLQKMIYVPTWGGANKANRLLMEALARAGHSCRVIAPALGSHGPESREDFFRALEARGISVRSATADVCILETGGVEVHSLLTSSRITDYVLEQAREFEPDWILSTSEDPGLILLEAALGACPGKVVYLVHTPLQLPFGPNSFLPNTRQSDLVRAAAGVVTVSRFVQDYIRTWSGIESAVYHFPAYGTGPFANLARADVGFVTLVNPCAYKGIGIFAALARELPEVPFAAVPTWGTTLADLALLRSLPNVTLLPAADDIETILAQTRILLMPSLWMEAFPLLPVEAKLRGIPVVASNVGGLPEAKLGVDYILPVAPIVAYEKKCDERDFPIPIVPDQNIAPWKATLKSLLGDAEHYRRLSQRSREAALRYVGAAHAGVFEELLAGFGKRCAAMASEKSPDGAMRATEVPENSREAKIRSLLQLRSLRLRRTADPGGAPTVQKLPRAGREAFPASYGQERLWLLAQMEPDSAAYIVSFCRRLTGPLDVAALEWSLGEIVRRHEVLRTTFRLREGLLEQVIAAEFAFKVKFQDVSAEEAGMRERRISELLRTEGRRSFDLERGPLLRATVLKLGPKEHILAFALHHIVADAWSGKVLMREFVRLYDALISGQKQGTPLPELAVQYADFADWQRTWLQGEALQRQLEFWKRRLANLPVLDWLTDKPRPLVRNHSSEVRELRLDGDVSAALKALYRREGVTPFMLLSAAFKVLVHRCSGEDRVAIGSPVASRTRREFEPLIGFFVNTLVFPSDLSGDPVFLDFLKQEREMALEAYAHQDLPFEKLLEELRPARDSGRAPFFQVFFNMLSPETERFSVAGLKVETLEPEEVECKFDLTLYAQEQGDQFWFRLVCSSSVFSPGHGRDLLDQFELLLRQIARRPEERVSHYTLVTPGMKDRLPNLALALPARATVAVHELFARQASRCPAAVAIEAGDERWTYRELDERSNCIGNRLRAWGLQPGERVAVLARRNPNLVAALLGVLKAKGSFVILDPAYPAGWLRERIKAASPRIFLNAGTEHSSQELQDGVAKDYAGWEMWNLPTEWNSGNAFSAFSGADSQASAGFDAEAYVAFTSGSTGTPKAICGTHGPLAHFVAWQSETFGLGDNDRFSLLSGLSHDPLLRDIFVPLGVGGVICIPEEEALARGDLASWIRMRRITVMHLTPSLGVMLAASARQHGSVLCLESLRYAFWGGELLSGHCVAALKAVSPGVNCVNFYGATETPQAVAWYSIPETAEHSARCYPVGKGIEGVDMAVVNRAKHLAGIGEVGTIWVRTPYLSRGYLNDSELTRSRFRSNWFGSCPEDRMYDTGDLGRYLADGNVQLLGRRDQQVKIRGYRVELGEVEAAIRHTSAVTDAAVILSREEGESVLLTAFIVWAVDATDRDTAGLRRRLQAVLPNYMVPGGVVEMERLPLTPNGKLDRSALPSAIQGGRTGKVRSVPQTASERTLVEIWQELLKTSDVGVDESFFDLGGHSLLAVQLRSRVRDTFGIELPLREFFTRGSTVTGLAQALDEYGKQGADGPFETIIRKQPREGGPIEFPLSHAQERAWFLWHLQPDSASHNMCLAVRITGPLRLDAFKAGLEMLSARHEILRTTFHSVDGQPRQRIHPAAAFNLSYIDLSHCNGERAGEARRLVEEHAHLPFDLETGPLVRAQLMKLEDGDFVAALTMHHIIADGWSVAVLYREFAVIYEAVSDGREPVLPELKIQFGDFAVWEREWLKSPGVERQLGYWRAQLDGVLPMLQLPADRPRPPVQSRRGAREKRVLPADLTQRLKEFARQRGVTLYVLLLAAFKTVLHRVAAQDEILVGAHTANRQRTETEGVVGMFINQVVLRSRISEDSSFEDFLRQVRDMTLDSFTHGDVPVEKIVTELKQKRDLGRTALFQAMIVLENASSAAASFSGLSVRPFEIERRTANLDLYFSLAETPKGLAGSLEYNTDIFDAWRARNLLVHFETLLLGVLDQPKRRLSELPLLDSHQRARILKWNETQRFFDERGSVHHWFETQAAAHPDRTAVEFETERFTYRELNARANQLAHYLRRAGVKAETRVGVCLERSIDLVATLMAVLKAGGAYVPLDPAFPEERIRGMIEDSGIFLAVTWKCLAACVGAVSTVVYLDDEDERIRLEPTTNPGVPTLPSQLGYVIYTSGSTGRPKGAMNTQEGLSNRLAWMQHEYLLGADDCVLQKTPYSFDVSVWEFFWPLAAGARLVVARPGGHRDPHYLVETITTFGVTTAHFVPSMLSVFLEERDVERCGCLKRVICSGEALTRSLQDRFHARLAASLHNLYGPTEASIDVTHWTCDPGSALSVVPIGRPIANTRIFLLDRHFELVPAGVSGELHIAGIGLARGYIQRPELTAERFVPDPFDEGGGGRLYRTGDLARYFPDGSIEYVGRNDFQVKIRGNRIELGEIETALERHPNIEQAAVMDCPGEQRLVAYVVARNGSEPSGADLRDYLGQKLPDYMVPNAFVVVRAMPVTANGKVDRRALPEPVLENALMVEAMIEPRTETESSLVRIWADVLGLERIGVRDNFFDMGGHSLLATQVISKTRQLLNVEVPLRVIFRDGFTVERLSLFVLSKKLQRLAPDHVQRLLDHLDELSEERVGQLLESEAELSRIMNE